MAKPISVTIVGPGSLGTAMAQALFTAGIRVEEIVYRDSKTLRRASALSRQIRAKASSFAASQFPGNVVWLCVGDAEIAQTARELRRRRSWKGGIVLHSSGALTSDELRWLARAGASVASVHPMMTFVHSNAPSMKGVTFALEGDGAAVRVARSIVQALGGESFEIRKRDKPLYHALGAFVSPLVVAQMAAVERIGRKLGLAPQQVRKTIAPILRQTVQNYLAHGPAAAFSGPIVRGDIATVRKNLEALRRVHGATEIYRTLARVAIEDLPSKDARGFKTIIG